MIRTPLIMKIKTPDKVKPTVPSDNRFRILCISGGGYRGLFSALVLAGLEESGKPFSECFDLIAGTSIGGIIACALAKKIPAKDIAALIEEHGSTIFPKNKFGSFRRVLRSKYEKKPLADVIVKIVGKEFAKRSLSDIDVPLLIPTISQTGVRAKLFRSKGFAGKECSDATILDCALATSAAPTYFPPHFIAHENLIDGGLVANAPDLVAITEVLRARKATLEDIHILSIGTAGSTDEDKPFDLGSPGIFSWMVTRRLFDLTLIAQERLSVDQSTALLKDRYIRIDADPSATQSKEIGLDIVTPGSTETLHFLAKTALEKFKNESNSIFGPMS